MSVTTGMIGHGFYNRNSGPQLSAIGHVLPWLDTAVANISLKDTSATIGLADFGCSEGRNSIAVMERLIGQLRQRTPRHIQTLHSDLPTNDFSSLFTDLRPNGHSVFDDAETSSCAVGGSMFDRLLPPSSIHFATTFNAIGFLSRKPLATLPGYILQNSPTRGGSGLVTDAEHRVFADQARDDVAAFLEARAIELVPGGKVLLQVFGANDAVSTADGIYEVLNDAVLEVLDAGLIDRRSYEDYYQPVYFRTLDELMAPLADGRLPFDVERQETYEAPVPFNEDYARTGDVATYAREYTNFYRAFTEPVLRLAFADRSDLDALVTQVFERAERLVRTAPDRYPFRYIALAALLTRRAD